MKQETRSGAHEAVLGTTSGPESVGCTHAARDAGTDEHGAGLIFVWADKLVLDAGSLVFMRDDGTIQGAIAPGHWDAVFEAGPDDSLESVETPR